LSLFLASFSVRLVACLNIIPPAHI
jgi:hypothetical protein